MTTIIDISARQILDSRGNPTVEVEVDDRGHWGLPLAHSWPQAAALSPALARW